MEKELVITGTFYLNMDNDETEKEAKDRFMYLLELCEIDWLDDFVTEVREY